MTVRKRAYVHNSADVMVDVPAELGWAGRGLSVPSHGVSTVCEDPFAPRVEGRGGGSVKSLRC